MALDKFTAQATVKNTEKPTLQADQVATATPKEEDQATTTETVTPNKAVVAPSKEGDTAQTKESVTVQTATGEKPKTPPSKKPWLFWLIVGGIALVVGVVLSRVTATKESPWTSPKKPLIALEMGDTKDAPTQAPLTSEDWGQHTPAPPPTETIRVAQGKPAVSAHQVVSEDQTPQVNTTPPAISPYRKPRDQGISRPSSSEPTYLVPIGSKYSARLLTPADNFLQDDAIVATLLHVSDPTLKGAKLSGSAYARTGFDRLFVLFTRLIMADGKEVSIAAHAMSGDTMGLTASIDRRTQQTFLKKTASGLVSVGTSLLSGNMSTIGTEAITESSDVVIEDVDTSRRLSVPSDTRLTVFFAKGVAL